MILNYFIFHLVFSDIGMGTTGRTHLEQSSAQLFYHRTHHFHFFFFLPILLSAFRRYIIFGNVGRMYLGLV